ncbi:MAG: hypothetical protein K2J10_11785 [Muribaculaceae bacterium]|nr:hypothetical protein [Muribaculaceae bacterium]
MKKFLLLLAGVSAYLSADAIELTFWMGNQKITPNQTVKFNDIDVVTYDEDGYKEVTMDPKLSLTADIYSSNIKLSATCTSGQIIQMCAGGTCNAGESVTKEKITVRPNQKLNLDFEYADEFDLDEPIPTVVTVIEAEDVTESGTKVQFIIEMGEEGASVTAIEVRDDFKAVEGGVAYKAAKNCPLRIVNILGVNVYSATVSGEGVINLPKGLYVYTFGNRSGKVYIR